MEIQEFKYKDSNTPDKDSNTRIQKKKVNTKRVENGFL
jgi:hypothetical protein